MRAPDRHLTILKDSAKRARRSQDINDLCSHTNIYGFANSAPFSLEELRMNLHFLALLHPLTQSWQDAVPLIAFRLSIFVQPTSLRAAFALLACTHYLSVHSRGSQTALLFSLILRNGIHLAWAHLCSCCHAFTTPFAAYDAS